MKKIRDKERLHHILDTIARIDSFLLSVDAKTFSESQEKQMAVCMGLTLIGEAARNLTTDFCSQHSEIPWAKIVGMSNYLVHDYIRIDYDAVWQTARNDLPLLKTQIATILAELQPSEKTQQSE